MEKLSTIQKRENLNAVYCMDEKGNGGANHQYRILESEDQPYNKKSNICLNIYFQNGARKLEDSIHGVLDGDLLEIVRHRLQGFQQGDFATETNQEALNHIEKALILLNKRVEDRIARSVLGTNNK